MPFDQAGHHTETNSRDRRRDFGHGGAYHLADTHRVTLIEAEPRLGGHARTVRRRQEQRSARRYRLHRLQPCELSAPDAAVPRPRRAGGEIRHELCRLHRGVAGSNTGFAVHGGAVRAEGQPRPTRLPADGARPDALQRRGREARHRRHHHDRRPDGRDADGAVVSRLLPDPDLGCDLVDAERGDHGFPRPGAGAVLPQPPPSAGLGPAPVVDGAGRVHRIRQAAGPGDARQGCRHPPAGPRRGGQAPPPPGGGDLASRAIGSSSTRSSLPPIPTKHACACSPTRHRRRPRRWGAVPISPTPPSCTPMRVPCRGGAQTWSSWNYTERPGHEGGPIDLNLLDELPAADPGKRTRCSSRFNSRAPIDERLIYDTAVFRHSGL